MVRCDSFLFVAAPCVLMKFVTECGFALRFVKVWCACWCGLFGVVLVCCVKLSFVLVCSCFFFSLP